MKVIIVIQYTLKPFEEIYRYKSSLKNKKRPDVQKV
jgi:hypothetical protein